MKNRNGFLVLAGSLFYLANFNLSAQLLNADESKVDSLIMTSIENNLVVPTDAQINDSKWSFQDELGDRILEFSSNGKFKLRNNGAMGLYSKSKGTWYIYDRYIVLEMKKEKSPLYHISYNGDILLLDPHSIDVMKKLIIGFVARDQLVAVLSEDTIFGFLNGFRRNDK